MDIVVDFILDIKAMNELAQRVDTACFGPVVFQVGVDPAVTEILFQRVADAQARFATSPLSQVATRLEQEVLVGSVFGTNTIEGGTLTEEETATALLLDPGQVEQIEQRRAVNIKTAYGIAQSAATVPGWHPDLDFIRSVHAAITDGIPHPHNRPGLLRNNPKKNVTYVGDAAHGGRYKPPQFGGDVELLLSRLVEWHDTLAAHNLPALFRAPLVHYYFELIHPFWDGNGRVGRVLEATILHAAGFRYAPFAMARFYLEKIDRYFTLFNQCRKEADRKAPFSNTPFVAFHLEGMLTSINRLHDRVNQIIAVLLFETNLKRMRDKKEINVRQYAILTQVLERGKPYPLDELRRSAWYEGLYARRGDKTRQRDLRKLKELQLVHLDAAGRMWPGFATPGGAA